MIPEWDRKKQMEKQMIEIWASRLQSERSTTEPHPRLYTCYQDENRKYIYASFSNHNVRDRQLFGANLLVTSKKLIK